MATINQALNIALNRAADLSKPENPETGDAQGRVVRFFNPRAQNLFKTFPREVALLAENTFWAIARTPGCVAKLCLKPIIFISGSTALKKFSNEKLPTGKSLLKTVERVIKYFIGTLSTLIFGVVLSTRLNFKAHIALNLATDLRAEEEKSAALEDQLRKEQAAQQATKAKEADTKKIAAEQAFKARVRKEEEELAKALDAIKEEVNAAKIVEPVKVVAPVKVAESPKAGATATAPAAVVKTVVAETTVEADEDEEEIEDDFDDVDDVVTPVKEETTAPVKAEIPAIAAKSLPARMKDAVGGAFSSIGTKSKDVAYGAGSLGKKVAVGTATGVKMVAYDAPKALLFGLISAPGKALNYIRKEKAPIAVASSNG